MQPNLDHPIRLEQNPHRIRVVIGGVIVAETTSAIRLREATYPPVLYIPRADIQMDLFERTAHRTKCPHKGTAAYFTATAGGLVSENAAWSYEDPFPAVAKIKGYFAFYPNRVDAIEEFQDEPAQR